MNDEEIQKKCAQMAEQQAKQQQAKSSANLQGSCGVFDPGSVRESLRDRISRQLDDAQRQQVRRNHLSELDFLLGKYPEIARILDLLEEVRG